MQAEDGAGNHAQRADGAGDEFGEIVARNIFDYFAATPGECAIGKSDGDADDEVAQRAEAKAKRAAVIGGEDPADGGFLWPKRIEREALAVLSKSLLQSMNRAARFGGDREVGPSVFQNSVEARG